MVVYKINMIVLELESSSNKGDWIALMQAKKVLHCLFVISIPAAVPYCKIMCAHGCYLTIILYINLNKICSNISGYKRNA